MYRWMENLQKTIANFDKLSDEEKRRSFSHFQYLLIGIEEELTLDESDDVIKSLAFMWNHIKDKKDLRFDYDNVAIREGWMDV